MGFIIAYLSAASVLRKRHNAVKMISVATQKILRSSSFHVIYMYFVFIKYILILYIRHVINLIYNIYIFVIDKPIAEDTILMSDLFIFDYNIYVITSTRVVVLGVSVCRYTPV